MKSIVKRLTSLAHKLNPGYNIDVEGFRVDIVNRVLSQI